MVDIKLDPAFEVRRSRAGVSDDKLGQPGTRLGSTGRGVLADLMLVVGDLAAGLLATLASFLLPGRADIQSTDPYNLLLLIACYSAFGLYTLQVLSPHARLRSRVLAVLLFAGVNLSFAFWDGSLLHALPFRAIQAVLLVLIGFYVELLVLRTISHAPLWDTARLIEAAQEPIEGETVLGGDTQLADVSTGRTPAQWLKRGLDLAIAVPTAVLLLPLIGLLLLAIKIIDPGPAVYMQSRVGCGGKRIRLFKIRSMYVDADERLKEHLKTNTAANAEWQRYFKLRDDPRVLSHIGHFMRRSSLDELPQLWNVIAGDMSLVGPRPLPDYHFASFDEEFQRVRASVTPGLTGFCQVMARRSELDMQKVHDLYYLQNRSMWLDLYILLQTVPAVLSGSGAR